MANPYNRPDAVPVAGFKTYAKSSSSNPYNTWGAESAASALEEQRRIQEEDRKRLAAQAKKQQDEAKKAAQEQKRQADNNPLTVITKLAKPISQGGINAFADVGNFVKDVVVKPAYDSAVTAAKQIETATKANIYNKGNALVDKKWLANQNTEIDRALKAGDINQQRADELRKKAAQHVENTKQAIGRAQKETGHTYNQSEGALAFLDTVGNATGLSDIGKVVFKKAAEEASKRFGRDLTKSEVDNLATKTKSAMADLPRKGPSQKVEVPLQVPSESPSAVSPEAPPKVTSKVAPEATPMAPPKVPREVPTELPPKLASPVVDTSLPPQRMSAVAKQVKDMGTVEPPIPPKVEVPEPTPLPKVPAPKEPTIAEISDANKARPAADIQKQIEIASNGGDKATAQKLITQLPEDMQQPVASAIGVEVPKVPTKSLEGELKTSGNAARIEAKAVERKLVDRMGDLPEYKTINMKDQAEQAVNLVRSDRQKAIDIVEGKVKPEGNLRELSVHQALEDVAMREGDAELLSKLAKSHVNTELSGSAQNLRIAAERDPHSPVEQLRQLKDERVKMAEKRHNTTIKAYTKKVKKEVDAATPKPTKQDWAGFVRGLTC